MSEAVLTSDQQAALEIYLDLDEDYKPPKIAAIVDRLAAINIKSSKSSVHRWINDEALGFKEHLRRTVNTLVAQDEKANQELMEAAGKANVKRTMMTLEENAELVNLGKDILLIKMQMIMAKYEKTAVLSMDDARFAKEVYTITAGREDKLHDRQAGLMAATLLSKDDVLKQLQNTAVEIEDEEFIEGEFEK